MDAKDPNHFIEVLPSAERDFIKTLLQEQKTKTNFETHFEKLKRLVELFPYPTLQILNVCNPTLKQFANNIIEDVLKCFLAKSSQELDAKFINLIANLSFDLIESSTLHHTLVNSLVTQLQNDKLLIALLCRPETKLLDKVLAVIENKVQVDGFPTKEFVMYSALKHKQHVVPLTCLRIQNFQDIADIGIRSNMLVLKIVNELSNTSRPISDIGNFNIWLEGFDVSLLPSNLQEIHGFFVADFKRLSVLIEFLKRTPEKCRNISIGTLLSENSILRLIFDNDILTTFDETRCLIDEMHKWAFQLPTKSIRYLEMETLTYYFALSTVFDVILADSSLSTEQYYKSKMQKLNTMLRQMRNIDVLCSLIEDIFQLMFLRWENIRCTTFSKNFQANRNNSSSNSTDGIDLEIPPVLLSTSASSFKRHGFICQGVALYCVFGFLKNFVTKKLHSEDYKHASERIQMRFQRIIDIISEALWKYSVIEKIDDSIASSGSTQPQLILEAEELLQLVQIHVDTLEKSSSDDDSRDRCNYKSLTRRKAAKKRRRATFSGVVGNQNVNAKTMEQNRSRANIMVTSISTVESSDPISQLKARNIIARLKHRSIVPRMLGSPESLAIMALTINNFNDVKYIIETFNLHNTELDHELIFVEQQQQVKQKLLSIYANYQQEEFDTHNREPKATVEQIKNVVAKGFEASKIISVIDNFAQAQKINQSEEVKQLLTKHCNNPHYSFLRQYKECNLNAVVITDLILNLPFNHEITTNILMVIKRQQQCEIDLKTGKEDTSFKQQLPKEIGCTRLLENICQCMRLLDTMSLRDLFYDNYYSFTPRSLELELVRERAFKTVFNRSPSEFGHLSELKSHSQLFQNLQSKNNYYMRFVTYVGQLFNLVQLRDKHLELHTSELLKYDPCNIIGELLFEYNMTPLEIEANVSALNLNLVHVIALNICPEIAGKTQICSKAATKLKQQSIFNYIWNHNRLLAYLLQSINKPEDLSFDCNMQPVFLQRLINLSELGKLSKLYDNKIIVAALRADAIDTQLISDLSSKANQLEILLLKFGRQDCRSAKLIDQLIIDLITEDAKNIYLAVHLNDIAAKAALIYKNFTKIATTRLAKELIESTLQHKDVLRVPQQLRLQLEDTLVDITVYAKVSEVLQFESWPQAYDFGLKTPNTIFESLLKKQMYHLCYKWCKIVKLVDRFPQHKRLFFSAILDALLSYDGQYEDNSYLLQIMESFPIDECCNFLSVYKDSFRSVELLKYVISFLTKNAKDNENYKNYKISLVIFEHLSQGEREQFWKLLKFPLLIIEQLIMNTKFETLAMILEAVRIELHTSSGENDRFCAFCYDKRGNIYNVHTKTGSHSNKIHFQLGSESASSNHSTFILLNFNLYQKDHTISNECIDLILRIYATKALEYQISDSSSGTERNSQSTDIQQSWDSLCGAFQMPKTAPTREDWICDDEASHCMCCKRAVFTMLMRRHHCRRCGRVVCFACSTHRMLISDLYADVEVRVCNDCHNFTEEAQRKSTKESSKKESVGLHSVHSREEELFKWKLSGNITHDKLLREEFCYEHAPSVALCLSILKFHLDQKKCVDMLLYHCRKMEKLIAPNPEVDYELVAKMINCLALAAKVRGGSAEIETICEHSAVIMSLVQNGCESFIPVGPLKNHSIRKLADSLVQAEKWDLALEVHLKYGFPTAGVMAAHGLSCLRAGCFDTAREKLSHCMPKLSNEIINSSICNIILSHTDNNEHFLEAYKELDIPQIKRPQRGPALLIEILKIIDSISCTKPQAETLKRASIIRNSNTSLSSLLSRRKDNYAIPMHEPALNILTTLANLKKLSKGIYNEGNIEKTDNKKHLLRQSRSFEEALHYILTYGSHADVIKFLISQEELNAALKYFIMQSLDAELFIQNIFLVSLRCGKVPGLIDQMIKLDNCLRNWRDVLIQTCRYLENKNLLNSLYQLQMLLKDPIRASMTCVKFYSMNCENFQQLHLNAHHLNNAHQHLLAELELAQWDNIKVENLKRRESVSRRTSAVSDASSSLGSTFPMQMDARSLNSHINTILKQLDVAKFLANCEREQANKSEVLITEKILKQIRLDSDKNVLPTLFDSTQDKIQICILILLSGKNLEEGFGLAYRIIQDYRLPSMKVYCATAKYLARNQRLSEVEKLLYCITSNNGTNSRVIDDILSVAIHSACGSHESEVKAALDNLAKKINSVELRISCHIFLGQLKSAYLLANKYERLGDIRKILRQAEISNQIHIKKLCEKKLNVNQPL